MHGVLEMAFTKLSQDLKRGLKPLFLMFLGEGDEFWQHVSDVCKPPWLK
jgi:hypothetical protein